jgi:outer membrane receptor protein involved in Fe transport
MKSSYFLSATALATSVFLSIGTVHAQDAAPDGEAAAEDAEQIIVTGSRIRRPNLESAVPITSVSGTEFFETGQISIGDVLNELPQLRSTFSQQNSTRFLGTRGLNLLDLRGLGTQRTLVLVNGRRHVAGDVLNNAVSPDTNTFPTDLIERIDIVTGGNSSIYGSDAVAGVVNFILKDNFEGVQVRGQSGISKYGDAANQYVSLLAGTNFSEDRGNIAINLEYAHSDRYFGSRRPNLRQNNGFVTVDSDPAGSPNGSDGIPDRTFFRDIRSATLSIGGQTVIFPGATGTTGGIDGVGGRFTNAFVFQRDGSLIPQTGTRVGLAPNGNFIGGNGSSNREGQLLTLTPSLDRYSANIIGHFEVSPAFEPFFEAKYVRTEAFGSVSGPLFSQGTTLGDPASPNRERVRLDNPFLSASARATLVPLLLATNVNANTGTALSATALAAQRTAINNGSFRFGVRRNYVDLGIRDEKIVRETYRFVGGVKGEFNDDWNYEFSLNYGEHRERNDIKGNINVQRFLLAIDSTRDTAGNIVCRSQIDPAAAVPLVAGAAILAADVAACVPLNPFGEGSVSQAARNYLTAQSVATGKLTQFVASGFVSGDFSNLFELPGGPISFSVGGEYRRETNAYDLDDLTQAGYNFYNSIPSFTAPAFEVKELFGEVSVPLLKDVPGFKDLTLTASGRVADYKGSTGTVYAYSGGVDWQPIQDLRLRGSYSRSVRAPNLNELFSAQGQNFAPAPNDPCSARNLATGSATRVANCNAAGRPANFDFVYTSSLEIISGGNPNLTEEESTSYTIGGIITPSLIPGLSISADYFDITVDNVITSVTAQNILNLCYDAADLNNVFCGQFQRAGASGGPRGEIPFQILEASLLQSTLNFAKFKTRGIDAEIAYRRKFSFGDLNLKAIYTRTLQRDQFTNPAEPGRADRFLDELGDPRNQVNFNADLKVKDVTFGYQLRWIDSQLIGTFEDVNSLQGRPPQNFDFADRFLYPDVFYHDIRLDVQATEKFNFYIGVDNATNRLPPLGLTGVGGGSGIYDVRGRYFYAGFKAGF